MSTIPRSVLAFALVAAIGLGVYFVVGGADEPPPAPPSSSSEAPASADPTPTGPAPSDPEPVGPPPVDPPAATDVTPPADPKPASDGAVPVESPTGGAIVGRVVAPGVRPLAGARVQVRSRTRGGLGVVVLGDVVGDATTGADGRFRVDGVPAGRTWAVSVAHDEYPAVERHPIEVFDGEPRDVGDVAVVAGARIHGTVRSLEAGPLAGVEVRAVDPRVPEAFGGRAAVATKTDDSGRFTLTRLRPGAVRVEVQPPEHAPSHWEGTLEAGTTQDGVELLVRRGKTIAGAVVDDLGAPIAGARVLAAIGQEHVKVESGADGRFAIPNLRDDGVYLVVARKAGYGSPTGVQASNEFTAGTSGIEIVLERRGRISGSVTDAKTGAPVPAFTVRWGPSYDRLDFERTVDAADGTFDIVDLMPVTLVFEVRSPVHAAARLPAVRFSPGHHVRGVEVRLRSGGGATGRVVDRKSGKPVVGAVVVAFDRPDPAAGRMFGQDIIAQRRVRRTKTDDAGRFTLTNLVGDYVLAVRDRRYALTLVESVRFVDGETATLADVKLGQGGVVTGFVKTAAGQPDTKAELLLHDEAGIVSRKVRSDADGRFTFKRVPAGRYQVVAVQREGRLSLEALMPKGEGKRLVTVAEGATVVVEL